MHATVNPTKNSDVPFRKKNMPSFNHLTNGANASCLLMVMIRSNARNAAPPCSFLNCISDITVFLWKKCTRKLCPNLAGSVLLHEKMSCHSCFYLWYNEKQKQRSCLLNPSTEKLRKKYIDNPPEGMTSKDICSMSDEDLPDMDYFLNDDESPVHKDRHLDKSLS